MNIGMGGASLPSHEWLSKLPRTIGILYLLKNNKQRRVNIIIKELRRAVRGLAWLPLKVFV